MSTKFVPKKKAASKAKATADDLAEFGGVFVTQDEHT